MRTKVMWRPPDDERRKQRRSGAGRHITVLATQPKLCDESHNGGVIDRGKSVQTRKALLNRLTRPRRKGAADGTISRYALPAGSSACDAG